MDIIKKDYFDDIATADDIRDIALARQELARGDVVDFNDIDWS